MIALGLVCGWHVTNINISALVGGGHASDCPAINTNAPALVCVCYASDCRPATNTNTRTNNELSNNRTNNYNLRHFSLIKNKISRLLCA